jgi:hypothetical protein
MRHLIPVQAIALVAYQSVEKLGLSDFIPAGDV